ncbi:cytochrome b [Neisseria iguanae]|uniref:Cytochrome B n=1 Tax=Neisseria iguanae TaxID=90242 RepID=A0A2P7U3B9_9NEIS|nr:cytochrome b/b6 domain-containing protein [Neisseria iguanae]PSJ81494.1 cytochrome B [Neisseria iguanae]
MKTDTPQRYSTFTRRFHWLMAACYLIMFGTALAWNVNENLTYLINVHRAVGILLLLMTLFRFVLAVKNFRHRPHNNTATRIGHLALYAAMFAVPASGMAQQAEAAFGNAHGLLAFGLLLLVAGHVMMTVIHQCKGEKIWQRMA